MVAFQGKMPKRGMRFLLTLFQRVSSQVNTQVPQAVRAISSATDLEVLDSMRLTNASFSSPCSHSRCRDRFGRLFGILKIGQFNSIFLPVLWSGVVSIFQDEKNHCKSIRVSDFFVLEVPRVQLQGRCSRYSS